MIVNKKLFKSREKANKTFLVTYNTCDIPAKLFYEVMHNGLYNLIGGVDNFDAIFDEYVVVSEDNDIRNYFQKNKKISDLQITINAIDNHVFTLANMYMLMSDEQIKYCVDTLNEYKCIRRKFDLKKNILDEILRMQNSVIGSLKNELQQHTDTVDKVKEKVYYSFEDDLVSLEMALGKDSLPDNITLYKFISLKKAAKKRHEQLKKQNNGK